MNGDTDTERDRERGWRTLGGGGGHTGDGKPALFLFAFHLHPWPYRPIGLGAKPRALEGNKKTKCLCCSHPSLIIPLLFFFSLSLLSISRYCPKCQRKSDTSACCASQIDRAGAAAEKAALATGPISTASSSRLLSLAGWELGVERGGGQGVRW